MPRTWWRSSRRRSNGREAPPRIAGRRSKLECTVPSHRPGGRRPLRLRLHVRFRRPRGRVICNRLPRGSDHGARGHQDRTGPFYRESDHRIAGFGQDNAAQPWTALLPRIDPASRMELIGKGVPAFAGVVSGVAVFTATEAQEMARQSRAFIFVRTEIRSRQPAGGHRSQGAAYPAWRHLFPHGALVCRQLGKVAVVGLGGNVTDDRTAIAGLSRPIGQMTS